tara:strand:+ start:91 stop:834 length:744 start_codon:yes stop_codon:yes gene_type:complete
MGKSKDLATGNSAAYVETAGDTMTGGLTVDTSTTTNLTVDSANYGGIQFKAAGTKTGYITSFTGASESMYIGGADKVLIHTGTNHDLTGGTTRLKIDASGNVTKPYQPSFLAYGPNSWITVSGGSTNAMTLSSTGYNIGSHYNASNYTFTAPVAGRYLFHLKTYVKLSTTDDDSNHAYTLIQKNGSNYYASYNIFGYFNHGDVDQNADVTTIISLSANDTVRPLLQSASGDSSYYGGACTFYGILLS